MKKNSFSAPVVRMSTAIPFGDVSGSVIGSESLKPVPMSFEEWLQSRWVDDYDGDPGVDFKDYAKWFADNGLNEAWNNFNPGVANTNEADK